ncbi:MAG: SIR2 family protein [Candidatus Acidiferrales bacterium]
MPSTGQITELVSSGDGVVRHTGGSYYIGGPEYLGDSVKPVLCLIRAIVAEIQEYYAPLRSHPVNYENCCYVATQLCDTESGEFDNPAVQPLIEKLKRHDELCFLLKTGDKRLSLFREAKHFIQDIVWREIAKPPSSLDYLGWLIDGAQDTAVHSTDFLTLNHDTLLEQALSKMNVKFCDGFGDASDNIRFWEPGLLEQEHRIRVCKLHGSKDWFWFRSKRRVGIPLTDDLYDTSGRPELLIGTFNKMHQYTASVFADLHCHFHKVLRRVNSLICCGYGFGDKGINTKLAEWIDTDETKRLVIVHPDPQSLKECSRDAIANHWQHWQADGKIRTVEKRIEQTCWNEVKAHLSDK